LVKSGWPLIGRTEEFAVVADAIGRSAGPGGVVLAGAAGVGKTRLAREAMSWARQRNRRCRWIVATTSARSVPLGAFAEFASNFGPDPLCRIQEVIEALTGPDAPMTTVVGVDDAHLLDEQSALLVHQLVHRRIATVLLTLRTGEPAPDAITSLCKDEELPRLELQPLSDREVALLVAKVLGGPVESMSAERLWRYTRGNVLYLHQLLADELASGCILKRSDLWVWEGYPDVSPTLIGLIESNIGRQHDSVVTVLDVLSIAEPLELSVLQRLSSSEAINGAESHGLMAIDGPAGVVRLGHPMFGEARRNRMGTMRRRELCGKITQAIGDMGEPSPQHSVQRAMLMLGSDRKPDPALLLDAAGAALQLLDLNLAIQLSHSATQHGGGRAAQLTYGLALAIHGRGSECEEVFNTLAESASSDAEQAHIGVFRAWNLGWNLGQPVAGERVLDVARDAAAACGLASSYDVIAAACRAQLGDASIPIDRVTDALSAPEIDSVAAMLGTWAVVLRLGDMGALDRLSVAASHGYRLARTAFAASHLRFVLGLRHVDGLWLAGALDEAGAVAVELRRAAQHVDLTLALTALLMGQVAIARGELARAQHWFHESLAMQTAYADEAGSVREQSGIWLATALAMAGSRGPAQRALDDAPRFFREGVVMWQPHRRLAEAWVHAASGLPKRATSIALEAAADMRSQNRPAREVLCLQAAVQFGDSTAADRLTDLSSEVQGPRVDAAAAHADALRKRDGGGLLTASSAYEAFGDRVAAADAAAQAAVAFRQQGRSGSSLTAAAVAKRLADACGADTPALRAAVLTTVLTTRQREIVSLVAAGLSNRDIAERLVMSVRSVESHLFRACQRTGVTTRGELAALLQGRAKPTRADHNCSS
jgi:DNA-binding CsgD family transcriptional regulator